MKKPKLKTSKVLRGKFKNPSSSSGQAIIEFVLVLPILILLIGASVDIGRALVTIHKLNAATRDGARIATEATFANMASLKDIGEMRTRRILIESGIPAWKDGHADRADVSARIDHIGPGSSITVLQVNAEYDLPFLFHFLGKTHLLLRSNSFGYIDSTSSVSG